MGTLLDLRQCCLSIWQFFLCGSVCFVLCDYVVVSFDFFCCVAGYFFAFIMWVCVCFDLCYCGSECFVLCDYVEMCVLFYIIKWRYVLLSVIMWQSVFYYWEIMWQFTFSMCDYVCVCVDLSLTTRSPSSSRHRVNSRRS